MIGTIHTEAIDDMDVHEMNKKKATQATFAVAAILVAVWFFSRNEFGTNVDQTHATPDDTTDVSPSQLVVLKSPHSEDIPDSNGPTGRNDRPIVELLSSIDRLPDAEREEAIRLANEDAARFDADTFVRWAPILVNDLYGFIDVSVDSRLTDRDN